MRSKVRLQEFNTDADLRISDALRELDRQGLRLATPEEVKDWCKENPEIKLPTKPWWAFVVSTTEPK